MKEDKENRIDSYFRDNLEDLNIIPPADVWNNIAENLPAKKGSRKMFLWIAVAASVSLFAAISGWNYLQNNKLNTKETTQNVADNRMQQEKTFESQTGEDSNYSRKETLSENNNADKNSNALANSNNSKANDDAISEEDTRTFTYNNEQISKPGASHNDTKSPESESVNNSSLESTPNSVVVNDNKVDEVNSSRALASIELKSFDTPDVYGKISTNPEIAIDTTPVYDNLYAAIDEPEKEKLNRWAISGQVAPLYTYRNITEVNAPGLMKASMNEIESAVVTYASGVIVDFEATSRLSIHTGVYYMKMGQEINNVSNFTKPVSKTPTYDYMSTNSSVISMASNSTGIIVTSSTNLYFEGSLNSAKEFYAPGNLAFSPVNDNTRKNIEQTFEFIEVPIIAKYKIIDRKVNLHLLGGVSTHVLVDNKTIMVSEDNSTAHGKTTGVETMNYSSSVGFGVGYNLRKNLLFSIEPTFKYYLNSFNSNDAVKLHPYAFGLYSGFSFKF